MQALALQTRITDPFIKMYNTPVKSYLYKDFNHLIDPSLNIRTGISRKIEYSFNLFCPGSSIKHVILLFLWIWFLFPIITFNHDRIELIRLTFTELYAEE